MHNLQDAYLIPKPTAVFQSTGKFTISGNTRVLPQEDQQEVRSIADLLSAHLRQLIGDELQVGDPGSIPNQGNIYLTLDGDANLGAEGYELSITPDSIVLRAKYPVGLFYGVQTLRQLMPVHPTEPLTLPALSIRDIPRFEWRGAMLDVARHFFGVEDLKRYIDLISHYKLNCLHLHLTDDQGWRIEIKSWPRLTEIGARTQAGGGKGGYYTQEQYKEIVAYARSRYVMIVPEIDTPSHTNAALASYAELNSSEEAPALYEGTEVGFSTLWINGETTYRFLEDVIRELVTLTPAPYIHIGGDEAHSTPEEEYKKFIKRMQEIVLSHGKTAIGWTEIGKAEILPGTIVQQWVGMSYQEAKQQGAKIILSPAKKVYLDMKYESSTPLGLDWAGLISVKDAYDWEPGSYMDGLEESDILGLEAPLWTETVRTIKDIEYLVFPRLLGVAELAWSPKGQSWEEYRQRLAAHGQRMEAMGIHFYKSPEVDWE